VGAVLPLDLYGFVNVQVGVVFFDEHVSVDVVVVVEVLKTVGAVDIHLVVEGAADLAGPVSNQWFFTIFEVFSSLF